jgi:hypothetical protein
VSFFPNWCRECFAACVASSYFILFLLFEQASRRAVFLTEGKFFL